jgi:putative FmdB family regulatory protein
MPTYDYECTSCGHTFEAFQSMSDKPLSKCPECGKKVQRLIGGGIGIIFKGSGFYVTDNKNSGGNGHAKKDTEKKEPAEKAGTEAKSEGKKSDEKKSDGKKKEEKKTA